MQLRKIIFACGFTTFALSNFANALGLGEVTLKSTLNEPLNAEVKLVDTRDLTADQILVALASPADFERSGIDRLYFYTEFQFQIVLDHPGGPIVRITTRNPVREPYLNFLIETRWTAGRLLREYTVLMDLPTFDESTPQPVQAAESRRATETTEVATATPQPIERLNPNPAQNSVKDETALVDEAVTANKTSASDEVSDVYPKEKPAVIAEQDQSAKKFEPVAGTYGPIAKKDTLWEIAKAVRPDSTVSVHQTMLALQRLNPDAFIRGNINLIKKGKTLRVPDVSETASVSKSEALNQVAVQNSEWSGFKNNSVANTAELGAPLNASPRASKAQRQAEVVSGRVKLETPLVTDNAEDGKGRGTKKGGGKALDSELSSTMEELDKSKFEKSELSSRVKDLEEQAKTMQKLTEANNEKLRLVQLNAAKQAEKKLAETKALELAAAEKSRELMAQSSAAVQASSIVSDVAESEMAASSVAATAAKPVKHEVVVAEKSIVDTLIDNILWLALGAIAVVGGAVFFMRRKKAAAETSSRFNNERDDTFSSEPNFGGYDAQENEYQSEPEYEEEDELEEEEELFEESETTAIAETGDVVGEADIYIAYGKFDQAEEMLLNGLAKDPQSVDIRLKLLEVYSHTQDSVAFDKHYAAILPMASAAIKTRANELRANIVGASQTQNTSSSFSAVTPVEDEFSFDLDDDYKEENPDKTIIKGTASNATTQRYNIDLNDAPITDKSLGGVSNVKLEDDDFSLDLDADENSDLSLDFDSDEIAVEAEDLSDISLALDGLDDNVIDDDLEVSEADEEFSFDFNELDTAPSSASKKAELNKATPVAKNNIADEFNLELDMNDIDLAALDQEMEDFDAGLESLDDVPVAAVTKPVSTSSKSSQLSLDEEITDDVFDQALSDFSADNLNDAGNDELSNDDLDSELDFMADTDESATKLDLARAYIDMGDADGARDILSEVAHEGNDQQRQEAVDLLSKIDE